MSTSNRSLINSLAKTGLISKGIVYLILGILAFMAAFEIAGQSDNKANQKGVFGFIQEAPAGKWLLVILAAGLACYSIWRMIEAFQKDQKEENGFAKRLRYFLSSLTYASVAFSAIKIVIGSGSNSDQKQEMSAQILDKPFGQWALGIAALILAGTGIYQIWYGLSEKYKKHTQKLNSHNNGAQFLLQAGKIGYVARGLVWLLLSYLMIRAALHANAKEAGDTGKAFQFLEDSIMGSYLLGALGIGLVLYGAFNFIRARYENFNK